MLRRQFHRLAGAAVIAAGLTASVTMALAEPVTLKVATFSSEQGYQTQNVLVAFLDRVVADSEGTLDYKLFAGGVLGRSPAEQLKLLQDGVADMAFVIPDYTPGALDSWGVVAIPGLIENAAEASIALERATAAGLLDVPDGVKMLGIFSSEVNYIHGKEQFTGLDDLAGKQIRAVGKAQIEALNRLGGVAVSSLRATEVAEGMSRGTVDATLMGYLALESFRVEDASSSHLELPMGVIALLYPMNEATWNSLPEPAKAAFEKHAGAAFAQEAGAVMDSGSARVQERLHNREGESVTEISPELREEFEARLGDIETVWIGEDPERQRLFDEFTAILQDIRGGS